MPHPLGRRSFLAFALTLPLLGSACNRELQGHAEVFLDALATDDHAKFLSIAGAELAAEIAEANFHDMAATYAALGPERDRTRTGLQWNDGVASVRYTLEHAQGEVYLTVVSKSDKLDGFEWEGAWKPTWVARQRKLLEQLLAAFDAGDRAAVRALCHPTITDAEVDRMLQNTANLGKHRSVAVFDASMPEFRVEFEKSELLMRVNIRGEQLVSVASRSPEATK